LILSAAMMLDWRPNKHGLEAAAEAGERMNARGDRSMPGGISDEFGAATAPRNIATVRGR